MRPYTVREYARLQGVPDRFSFAGGANDAYRTTATGFTEENVSLDDLSVLIDLHKRRPQHCSYAHVRVRASREFNEVVIAKACINRAERSRAEQDQHRQEWLEVLTVHR